MKRKNQSRLESLEADAQPESPADEIEPAFHHSEIEWMLCYDYVRDELDDALVCSEPDAAVMDLPYAYILGRDYSARRHKRGRLCYGAQFLSHIAHPASRASRHQILSARSSCSHSSATPSDSPKPQLRSKWRIEGVAELASAPLHCAAQ
jgi:hypothetical protein